ncbi:EAL domain-containing protein [Legionella sp.]|uniref:GGDEF/EAL domain-containing response regulator n=1 Tax=Legionella sp. TaxID=459 RepID=UPI0032204F79
MSEDLRIIVIDDNPAIHQDFKKVLTASGHSQAFEQLDEELFGKNNSMSQNNLLPNFEIDSAEQGHEGVEKIKYALEQGKPYALAFVDIRMPPGWDGLETIMRIWEIDKDIQIVICTAYSDYSWEETVQKLGVSDNLLILKKPFDKIAVRQLACALTRKWLLARESKNHTELLHRIVNERTESLQQSLSLLRATIESSTNGILVVDLSEKIVDYNQQFIKIWNVPRPILESKDANLLFAFMLNKLQKPKEYLELINRLYNHIDDPSLILLQFKKKEKIIECYSQPHQVNTTTVGRVWSFHDITERAFLELKLEHQATHDSLTDLPNRVLLIDRIQQSIASAIRRKKRFAIFFLDLDRFKLINDSLSHKVGDELLLAVSKRLLAVLRKEDTLARLGGDEFVMIIPELANNESVVNVAQKVLTSFNQPFYIAGREIPISTSIGISLYPSDGKKINTLLRNADLAMYNAKEQGGNQFKFYIPKLNQDLGKRLQQEAELRRAIANHEFFLLYQPQFDMEENYLVGVEALMRWQHPQKGTILPLDFIPIAEETGLIVPIGEWVIQQVCEQLSTWKKNNLPLVRISINVTTQQLKQAHFATTLESYLKQYDVDPQYLELEITENVIITHIEIQQMIQQIKKLGVQIVLDDFGTGNSSLNYLKKLYFDRLKIDQSFVQNISKSRSDEVIIEAIIAMARSFNFQVLAEGVETQKQINFLKEKNCDGIQGFFLSKPVPPDKITKILNKKASGNRERL